MGFVCNECQEPQNYTGPEPVCYGCAQWLARIQRKQHPAFVVVAHRFYVIGSVGHENGKVVHFHDGRIANATDLYDHGVIPERFRERLPDNATFVR